MNSQLMSMACLFFSAVVFGIAASALGMQCHPQTTNSGRFLISSVVIESIMLLISIYFIYTSSQSY